MKQWHDGKWRVVAEKSGLGVQGRAAIFNSIEYFCFTEPVPYQAEVVQAV